MADWSRLQSVRQHIKNNTYLFRVLYLIFIVIPFVMAFSAYFLSARLLGEESFRLNRYLLEQASGEIESLFQQKYMLSQQLFLEYDAIRISGYKRPLTLDQQYHITMAVSDLKGYGSYFNFKGLSFFIYYPSMDYVLTPEAAYKSDFFFREVISFTGYSNQEDINSLLSQRKDPREFSINQRVIQGRDEGECLTFVSPLSNTMKNKALLVVMIDSSEIKRILNRGVDESTLFFQAEKDNYILSGSMLNPPDFPEYEEKPLLNGIWYSEMGKSNYALFSRESDYGRFRYLFSIPVKVFKRKVFLIRNVLFSLAGGLLIIGLYILYMSSSRVSDLFFEIKDKVISSSKYAVKGEQDVLTLVRESVNNAYLTQVKLEDENRELVKENEISRRRINENFIMVQSSLLRSILQGDHSKIITHKELLTRYEIYFNEKNFLSLAIQLDYPWNAKFEENKEQSQTMDILINTLVNEISLGPGVEIYPVYLNRGEYVILINYSHGDEKWVYETSKRIHSFLMNNLEYSLTLGIGTTENSAVKLEKSLDHARDALHYRIIVGHGAVISYSEIKDEDKEYFYPIDIELSLINCVRSGDITGCLTRLDDVFRINLEEHIPSVAMVQCLFYDMISTVIKVLDSLNIPLEALFPGEEDILVQLTSCDTVDQMHQRVKEIFEETCLYVNKSKERDDRERADLLKEIIDNTYRDINFSQSLLAERAGISPPFLSSFFKEYFGVNMQEYVQRKRIDEACELLKNNNLLLTEVAERVGYTSDKTLIRVFKQYLGITPGKYRELKDSPPRTTSGLKINKE